MRKIIEDEKLMNLVIDFLNDESFIEKFVDVILHLKDKEYLKLNGLTVAILS